MTKYYEFLKGCGVFYLVTINGTAPAARPFGAVMENDGNLFITAADTKAVYRQMKQNSNIQIVALKHGTRKWIRISGNAEECTDGALPRYTFGVLRQGVFLWKHGEICDIIIEVFCEYLWR